MTLLRCPVCELPLNKMNKQYICKKGHSFDISKQGYTNLLLKQSSKTHGDNKDMLLAREYIQEKGLYKSIAKKILAVISNIEANEIIDIGCGTGYYTSSIQETLNKDIFGVDISKEALKIAARNNKNVAYFVASNKSLPFIADCFDLVLNVFSPLYLEEALRVLKTKGYILVVSSNELHLIELKRVIYDSIITKKEDRNVLNHESLTLVSDEDVVDKITLTKEEIKNLFLMTPHYWTSSVEGKERLNKIEELSVQININFMLYKYKKTI